MRWNATEVISAVSPMKGNSAASVSAKRPGVFPWVMNDRSIRPSLIPSRVCAAPTGALGRILHLTLAPVTLSMSAQNGTSMPAVRGCAGGAEELALSTTCAKAGDDAKTSSPAPSASFTVLEPQIRPGRAAQEPRDVRPAEQPVVGETGAVVPQRPADVALGSFRGTRAAHELHCAPGARKRDGDHRRQRSEQAEGDERSSDGVDQRDGRDVERAGRALPEKHRQRPDPLSSVEVQLIDVLADQNRHHAQAVR